MSNLDRVEIGIYFAYFIFLYVNLLHTMKKYSSSEMLNPSSWGCFANTIRFAPRHYVLENNNMLLLSTGNLSSKLPYKKRKYFFKIYHFFSFS
jgi:hypothetical protein